MKKTILTTLVLTFFCSCKQTNKVVDDLVGAPKKLVNSSTGQRRDQKTNEKRLGNLESKLLKLEKQIKNIKLVPGPKGDKGDRGDKGDKGDRGKVGPRGPMGPRGLIGRSGKDGSNGKNGKSCAVEYDEIDEILSIQCNKKKINIDIKGFDVIVEECREGNQGQGLGIGRPCKKAKKSTK